MKNKNLTAVNISKKILTTTVLLTNIYGCSSYSHTAAPLSTEENKTKFSYADNLQRAQLFATLPNSCPTPDGLAIAPNGYLTLACTNYANKGKQAGVLLSISPLGEVNTLGKTPGVKINSKGRPMGIAYAPDGSLYACDNGRILRITFKAGKIATTEVVVRGLTSPNGIRIHNGSVFVSLIKMKKIKTDNITSAIYRFSLDDRNLKVSSTEQDPQLLFKVETKNPERQFGLDGLVFDKAGHLYTGNFGDGEIYKLTLSEDSKKVTSTELYAKLPKETGLDGIVIDQQGNLYVAGFLRNQIIKIDTDKNISVIAQYPDNNGSNGQIDQPSELIVFGDKLVISNFDLMSGKGIINTKHSAPYTLSYLDLSKQNL